MRKRSGTEHFVKTSFNCAVGVFVLAAAVKGKGKAKNNKRGVQCMLELQPRVLGTAIFFLLIIVNSERKKFVNKI